MSGCYDYSYDNYCNDYSYEECTPRKRRPKKRHNDCWDYSPSYCS